MALSLPVFAAFAWWQKRKERTDGSPLVLPALFKNHSFGVGLSVNAIFEMAMIGFFLTFTLVLQIGLGFSAVHAALTGIPTAFGIAMTMAVAGEKLVPKLGRYALSLGTAIMAVGLASTTWVLHHYNLGVHSWQLIPTLFTVGVGMGLVFGSLFAAVLNGVDAKHAGSASGVLNAVQQVGGAIGVALIGVIFFGQLSHGATSSFATVEPQLRQTLQTQNVPAEEANGLVKLTKDCFVARSKQKDGDAVPNACVITADSQPVAEHTRKVVPVSAGTLQQSALTANATNFNKAFRWSMIYALGLLVLTFSLSFALPKHFRAQAYAEL
jgi:hypothetical protein